MASFVTFSERIVFLFFLRIVAEYEEENTMAFTEERRREKRKRVKKNNKMKCVCICMCKGGGLDLKQ